MKKKLVSLLVLGLVLAMATGGVAAQSDTTITIWAWDPAFNIYAPEESAKIYA